MRRQVQVPQWIPTVLLILLAPVIGYLVYAYVEGTRDQQNASTQSATEAQLITFMAQQYDSEHPSSGYVWTIERRDGDSRLVCYCDDKGYGWWYQVQTRPDGQFTATEVADTSAGPSATDAPAAPTATP